VDERFKPIVATQAFKERYQLRDRYVLFVGQTTANKNLRRGIDAVNLARNKFGLNHQFIIAGLPGEDDAKLKRYVNESNLHGTVRFIGYVDDIDLPQLYANSELLLFPSINEGFGIPPLEAMRCGIPVVAAQASCLPEVLGDAPIWVNPLSVESIAEGIGNALLDKKARISAIAKGLTRVERFSWEKMALETVKVYREALRPMTTRSSEWDSRDTAIAGARR
jgi:glycosyltransferase involved in cell wall biosynthesis